MAFSLWHVIIIQSVNLLQGQRPSQPRTEKQGSMNCPVVPKPQGEVVFEYRTDMHNETFKYGWSSSMKDKPYTFFSSYFSELTKNGWDNAFALTFEWPSEEHCDSLRVGDSRGTSLLYTHLKLEQNSEYKLTMQIHVPKKTSHVGLNNGQAVVFPCHPMLHPNMDEAVTKNKFAPTYKDLVLGPPVSETEFVDLSIHFRMRHADVSDTVLLALGSGGKGHFYIRTIFVEKVANGTCDSLAADGDSSNDCVDLASCADYAAFSSGSDQPYKPGSAGKCLDEEIYGEPLKMPAQPFSSGQALVFGGLNPSKDTLPFLMAQVVMIIMNEAMGLEAMWSSATKAEITFAKIAGINHTLAAGNSTDTGKRSFMYSQAALRNDSNWLPPEAVPTLAVTMAYTPDAVANIISSIPQRKRERLLSLGSTSINIFEAMFITKRVVEKGKQAGVALDAWTTLAQDSTAYTHFPSTSDIDSNSGLDVHEEYKCGKRSDRTERLTAANFACVSKHWWITPNVGSSGKGKNIRYHCIPFILQDTPALLFDILNYTGIPVCATAFAFSVDLAQVIKAGIDGLTWFQYPGRVDPDSVNLVNMPPKFVPFRNPFQKIIWGNLRAEHQQAYGLMQRFDMRMSDVEQMLANFQSNRSMYPMEPDASHLFDESCLWLRAHVDAWKPWLDVKCDPGFMNNPLDETSCKACSPGRYNGIVGSKMCQACAQGTASQESGSIICASCPPGRHANGTGKSACESCAIGTYQPMFGSNTCDKCTDLIQGSTTLTADYSMLTGAESSTTCGCAPNLFFVNNSQGCVPCMEGMACRGGVETPRQRAGFYAEPTSDGLYSVYRCKSPKFCLEGSLPGTCAEGRVGIACDLCEVGRFAKDDGSCETCGNVSGWIWGIVLLILGFCGLVVFFLYTTRDPTHMRQTVMSVGCCCGISVTAAQALGAFNELQIEWIEPMVSLSKILDVFALNIDAIQPTCVFGISSAPSHYAGSLLTFPILAALMIVFWFIFKFMGRPILKDRLVNSIGLLFLIGYLALAITSMKPLQCFNNPSALPTVATHRSVVCNYRGAHFLMTAMSVVGIIVYPVGYLSMVGYCTLVYKQRLVQPGGIDWLKRFAFLFQRFSPARHYYGFLYMVRNLIIAVLPSLLANHVATQLMLLTCTITVFLCIQCNVWPWRTDLANCVDIVFSVGLIHIMVGGCMLLDLTSSNSRVAIQIFFFIIFVVCFFFALNGVLFAAWRIGFPPKRYGIFLCHHKGGAAVLARYFKEVLSDKTSEKIFLDSDELDALDLIFDTVGEDTKNLVILLTSETLWRMWCAGEIYSAFRCNVNIVPVVCAGEFKFPTDEFLEKELVNVWTEQQRAELANFGIELHNIRNAYQRLRDIPVVNFPREGSFEEQDVAIAEVVSRCVGLKGSMVYNMQKMASTSSMNAECIQIAIIGNTRDVESLCTCQVLQRLIQQATQADTKVITNVSEMEAVTPSLLYVVVVLTRGILDDVRFAELCQATQDVEIVNVLADTSFVFPDDAYYERLMKGKVMPLDDPFVKRVGIEWICECYKTFFNVLALRFSSHGSSTVQAAEVAAMKKRFRLDRITSSASVGRRTSTRSEADASSGKEGLETSRLQEGEGGDAAMGTTIQLKL